MAICVHLISNHPSLRRARQSIIMSESVQTFGRKKTATAVAFVKKGTGLIKVNGAPISLLQPEILKLKTYEPILLLGSDKFANVDIRVRVKGGGTTSQIYAIRQAIAKGMKYLKNNVVCFVVLFCSYFQART